MLAFSSISTRKGAWILISASVLFALYCIPWPTLIAVPNSFFSEWLLDDWSWFAMMIPIIGWYGLSLNWMDRHSRWPN